MAEVPKLPGVLAYGVNPEEAMTRVKVLALRVIAERLEHGESRSISINISIPAAAKATDLRPRLNVFWPRCFGSTGKSSDNPVLTKHWPDRGGQTACSLSTIVKKSARECSRIAKNTGLAPDDL